MNKEELIDLLKKSSQESLNEASTVEEEIPEEEVTPKKTEPEVKESKSGFKFLYIILILMAIISYLLISQNQKENAQKATLIFEDLPKDIRANYITKEELSNNIQAKEDEINLIVKQLKEELSVLNEKFELANIEKNEIRVDAQKNRPNRYDATGCYAETEGTYEFYDSCTDRINKFLEKNKNATSFQIIPVVDIKDKVYIKDIISNIKDKDIDKKPLKDYLMEGLSRKRVLEASWHVKKQLGKEAIITYVNYIADTADKRGFTIRAYR